VRLILRRSEALRQQAARRRADKWAKLQRLLTARNTFVQTSKRAKPETGLRTLQAWVKRHKLEAFVQVSLHDGRLMATLDTAAQAEATVLDGCYVLETDVPQTALAAQAVHDRYRDLHAVEQDFRTMKTGLLEVRPIFVRKAPRTRAHVLVTMLALKVVREMRRALVAAFGTTDDDKMAVTVEEALLAFARLCLLTYHVQGTAVTRLPTPDARQKAILDALGTPLPPPRSLRKM
jgi:transposase